MKKSEILESYSNHTGISYKHQQLFVGDVYKNKFDTYGMVISKKLDDGSTKYYFKKTNMCEHGLPEDRAGLNDGEFVANVVQDEALMEKFIKARIIEDDSDNIKENETMTETKTEEKKTEVTSSLATDDVTTPVNEVKKSSKKSKKQVEEVVGTAENTTAKSIKKMSIYEKINAVRAAWNKENVEKEGKGKAGGGAKYDYYKPQQVIDFCLKEELKNRLYSDFNIIDGVAVYSTIDLDWEEGYSSPQMVTCQCPADVPRKMAASEAQQIGAAMTYYNRRLAMMLYKIEDNSKESVDVLENADYTQAPEIPTPPIVPAAPIVTSPVVETTIPDTLISPVQTEVAVPSIQMNEVKNDIVVPPVQESAKSESVVAETEQKEETKEEVKEENTTPPTAQSSNTVPPPPHAEETKTIVPLPATETPKKTGSIEDLY